MSKKKIDIIGQRFGCLVTIKEVDTAKRGRRYLCRCNCGNKAIVRAADLVSGHTLSCGCRRKETVRKATNMLKKEKRIDNVVVPLLKSKLRKDNKTGIKGVFFDKETQKYGAVIYIKKKRVFLGRFSEFVDAVTARREAEIKYFKPILDKEKGN